jgi:hypothetical protein
MAHLERRREGVKGEKETHSVYRVSSQMHNTLRLGLGLFPFFLRGPVFHTVIRADDKPALLPILDDGALLGGISCFQGLCEDGLILLDAEWSRGKKMNSITQPAQPGLSWQGHVQKTGNMARSGEWG